MTIDITANEKEMLLAALDLVLKSSKNSLQAANEILPLAVKIQSASANDSPQ